MIRPEIKLTQEELDKKLISVAREILCGLTTDGAQHKQYFMEQALVNLYGQEFVSEAKIEFDWIKGIAP